MKSIIHVGYPKAASSTLQRGFFGNHPNINFMGLWPVNNLGDKEGVNVNKSVPSLKDSKVSSFFKNITELNSVDYFYSNNHSLMEYIKNHYMCDKKINVFSDERLINNYKNDPGTKLDRIFNLVPDACFLVVIRNQYDIIMSQYADQPFDPRSRELGKKVSLSKWIKICRETYYQSFLASIDYYRVLNYLSNKYGRDKVKIVLFEDLVKNLDRFSNQLEALFDINQSDIYNYLCERKENPKISKRYQQLRILRRIIPIDKEFKYLLPLKIRTKIFNYLKKGDSFKTKLGYNEELIIQNLYKASNQKLREEFSLPLDKYNYPL